MQSINIEDVFILKDGKLLDSTTLTTTELNELLEHDSKTLEIYPRMRGGGVLDMFASIIQIGKVFFFLLDLILWLIKFIAWFIMFIIAFLKFLLIDISKKERHK